MSNRNGPEFHGKPGNTDPHFLEPSSNDIQILTNWMDSQIGTSPGVIDCSAQYAISGYEFAVRNRAEAVIESGEIRQLDIDEAIAIQKPEKMIGPDALDEEDLVEWEKDYRQWYAHPELDIKTPSGKLLCLEVRANNTVTCRVLNDGLGGFRSIDGKEHGFGPNSELDAASVDDADAQADLGTNTLNLSQYIYLNMLLGKLLREEQRLQKGDIEPAYNKAAGMIDGMIDGITGSMHHRTDTHELHRAINPDEMQILLDNFDRLAQVSGKRFMQAVRPPVTNIKSCKISKEAWAFNFDEDTDGKLTPGDPLYILETEMELPTPDTDYNEYNVPELIKTKLQINQATGKRAYSTLILVDVMRLHERCMELFSKKKSLDPDSEESEALSGATMKLSWLVIEGNKHNRQIQKEASAEQNEGFYQMSQADANEIKQMLGLA